MKKEKEVIYFYADNSTKAFIRKLAKENKRTLSFCMNHILKQARKSKNVDIPAKL